MTMEKNDFHPGSYTLDFIVRNLALPQVIRCHHKLQHPDGEGGGVGCDTPVLLHRVKDSTRLIGIPMVEEGNDNKLKETGNKVHIPLEFDGWFTVFRCKPKAKNVPLFHQMQALINAECEVFLLGGKRAIQIITEKGTAQKTALAHPGDVFSIKGVTEDKTYVQCMDTQGQSVLVDICTQGVFYIVSSKTKIATKVQVKQAKDIIADSKQKFPCLVKLIFSRKPFQRYSADGWIKITGSETIPVLVAATASLKENGLVEIPRMSKVQYKVATMNGAWKEFAGYKDALRVCELFADAYCWSIKSSKITYESDLQEKNPTRKSLTSASSIAYRQIRHRSRHQRRTPSLHNIFGSGLPLIQHKVNRSSASHVQQGLYVNFPITEEGRSLRCERVNVTGNMRIFSESNMRLHEAQVAGRPRRRRAMSDTGEENIYVNQPYPDEASIAGQISSSEIDNSYPIDPHYVNVSDYATMVNPNDDTQSVSDEFSDLSFSDEWGDDDHDYVDVDDMFPDESDDDSSDYIPMWNYSAGEKIDQKGEGHRVSTTDSGVFSIAGID